MNTRTHTIRKNSVLAAIGAVALAITTLGFTGPASALSDPPPAVTPFNSRPATDTVMPNFDNQPVDQGLRATPEQFSVSVDGGLPGSVTSGTPLVISGHTTGFSPGNWINVWVRTPDGQQFDDGGLIATDGSFTIPATLVVPGTNTVQLSAGAYPEEQWSTPVQVTVTPAPSDSPVARAYHNLTGRPEIVSTITHTPRSGERVLFNYCPTQGGLCDNTLAANTDGAVWTGELVPNEERPLSLLAPNSPVSVMMTYQYF